MQQEHQDLREELEKRATRIDLKFCDTLASYMVTGLMMHNLDANSGVADEEPAIDSLIDRILKRYSASEESRKSIDSWMDSYRKSKELARSGELKKTYDSLSAINAIKDTLTEEQAEKLREHGIDNDMLDQLFSHKA